MADQDTRHSFFTTPYQIEVAKANSGPHWGSKGQQFGVAAIQDVFKPGGGGKKGKKGDKQKGGGKKGNQKGGGKASGGALKKKNKTDDGRAICFLYNKGRECDGSCGMVHCCQLCEGDHPMTKHPKKE